MGKITDRFMNRFGGKDDDYDDFDEDLYDDDLIEDDNADMDPDDDPAEPGSKTGRIWKTRKPSSAQDYESREPAQKIGGFGGFRQSKSAPLPPANSRINGGNEVCIFKPTSIEDSREITDTLLDGKAVVINFEGLHVEISQRIIDFISGSCYALDGNLQKISNYIFIATPKSVDISGDFQDLLSSDEGAYDAVSGIKTPLFR